MKNQLSANLVALMDYHRIGGVQLARAINIPLSTIKNIRKGANVNPTIETLIPLARYFNVALEEIISSNLSVEKIAMKKNKTSPQAVPVLSLEEAVNWPQSGSRDLHIFTEKVCSERAFAVHSEQNSSESFAAPGIFLVDTMLDPTHFDYVLVHKLGLARASVKQIICDEDSHYLKSLVIASKLELLDKNYRLLGVMIEYRQFFKSLDDEKNKVTTHHYSSHEEITELVS